MKVLKIIHGYPPLYNAGSEVYSQTLCKALTSLGHEVEVFCREENPFAPDYELRTVHDGSIPIHLINIPVEKHRYRYHHDEVNKQCSILVEKFKPNIIHIGHLNHLSLTLVKHLKRFNLPIVYTLHDFWLMCPRGQFVQRNSEDKANPWALCSGQNDRKCADKCYRGYYSGNEENFQMESDYWTQWVKHRMETVAEQITYIDKFIAPSEFLFNEFRDKFNLQESKLIYMDYGFELDKLSHRQRTTEKDFVFGYIGTHIPSKGVNHLIDAFKLLNHHQALLRIWGRAAGQNTLALKRLVETLPQEKKEKIEWMSEYDNSKIVDDVFNHVDCIVVPSIWQENSPLVIHEALQARVGVITANTGGMSEYIHHEVNGWLFTHRNKESLADIMDQVLSDKERFDDIRNRGYLKSKSGDVISHLDHGKQMISLYETLLG